MKDNQISDKLRKINSGIDFRRILGSLLSQWYWFVLSLGLFLISGFLYLRYTTPQYSIKSLLLIEPASRNLSNSATSEEDVDKAPNLFNEMFILTSKDLVEMTVDSLSLNIRYLIEGRVREEEVYKECPVKVVFDSSGYVGKGMQKIRISEVSDGLFRFQDEVFTARVLYDSWIKRPYGRFKILYNEDADANQSYLTNHTEILARIEPRERALQNVLSKLEVDISDDRTSLLELCYVDNNPARGTDFMNALITQYRVKELEYISQTAKRTKEFIESLKIDMISDLHLKDSIGLKWLSTAGIRESRTTVIDEKTDGPQQGIATQLLVQKQAIEHLKKSALHGAGSRFEELHNSYTNHPLLDGLVAEYNTMVQRMQSQERKSDPSHPNVFKTKIHLASLRKRMADACDRAIASINERLREASESLPSSGTITSPDAGGTKKEHPLLQGIYLYLYKLGVENDISQYAASNKSKIVVAPNASNQPIKPVPQNVYLTMLLLGLLLPSSIIVTRVMLNDKVINEKDIEMLTDLPIIGAIARAPNGQKKQIVVGPHIRTGVAEQFRLIRANLEFMSATGNKKVYLVTSSMSGEGKTFVSLNLGITMTLAKKRVVVMEFDLRKPKLSKYLGLANEGGISGYLAGISGIEKVIKASGVHENLYIANCGAIPPNPGELLVSPYTQQLIEELQEMFDIIIMDTAPIGLVSDALILSQYSDINMFILRQSYTIKDQIRLFDSLHKENKIRNAALIFNGVEYLKKYGYGGSYGLGYQTMNGEYYDDEPRRKRRLVDKLFRK